jgi:hypothetical protein
MCDSNRREKVLKYANAFVNYLHSCILQLRKPTL